MNPPFLRHRTCACLGLVVVAVVLPALAAPSRHLFLDPAGLLESQGATLRVNPPSQGELVLRPDRPWEDLWIPFYTTVRDEEGKLRMWYNCRDRKNRTHLAYAESRDGINWTKPNLGLVDYDGSSANNLVAIHTLEGAVYCDPQGSGDERYVYVASIHQGGGVFRFTSPDGLRWQRDAAPLLPFECDSQNVTFWDATRSKYVLYLRGWGPKGPRDDRRKVVRVEADRLSAPVALKPAGLPYHENGDRQRQPWIDGEAPIVLACDERDPTGVDVYTSAIQPYPLDPRWYVGFPAFYRHFPGSPHRISDGWTEVQFAGSRDGLRWHRYDRTVYAGPGLPGPFSGSMVYLGVGLIVRGAEIWQYGTRYRTTHGDLPSRQQQIDGAVYRFVQRVDGFVSLDFAPDGGRCRTVPVKVEGRHLVLNLDTGALGQLRVGLRDTAGNPIEGFGAEDGEVLRLNSTRARATWKGDRDLTSLLGRDVQLAISASRAKLYSFFFESDSP